MKKKKIAICLFLVTIFSVNTVFAASDTGMAQYRDNQEDSLEQDNIIQEGSLDQDNIINAESSPEESANLESVESEESEESVEPEESVKSEESVEPEEGEQPVENKADVSDTSEELEEKATVAIDYYVTRANWSGLVNAVGMTLSYSNSGLKQYTKNKTKLSVYSSQAIINCSDTSVSLYGVTCGMTMDEVNACMKKAGWPPMNSYTNYYVLQNSYVTNLVDPYAGLILSCSYSSDGRLSSWVWDNKPLGFINSLPFSDVPQGCWYYNSVISVYQNWLMTGMNNSYFGASDFLSRGQFVCVLHRMAGEPYASYNGRFPDVSSGQFYTLPVTWASNKGIVAGYSNGRFGPADNVTREQAAIFLYRFAQYNYLNTSYSNNLSSFPDRNKVSPYALTAMKWAVGAGLISGDNGKLNPQGLASRAQCASMIERFRKTFSGE